MANQERKADRRHALLRGARLLVLAVTAVAPVAASTRTVIDTSASFDWPSIKVGGDGLGLVACYDRDDGDLKVAHCNDLTCSSAAVPAC